MIITNSLTGGGAERSMNIISREMHKRGWPVLLVPINSGPNDLIETECSIAKLDRIWKSGAAQTFFSYMKFQKVVREWRPDCLIINTDLPEFYAALTPGKQMKVIVEHSPFAWSTRRSLGRIIRFIFSIRGHTKLVAVSSHLTFWGISDREVTVIQNPIDSMGLSKLVLDNTSGKIKRIVFIGRLENPQKQPNFALEIASNLKIPVLFLGTGGMFEMLQEIANNLHVDAEFAGFVHNPWLYITGGDLIVVPSAWEGDGLVVLEALQRGIPIIVSDIEDFRRFNLPNQNYCGTASDFTKRIKQFDQSIQELIIDSKIVDAILSERSPNKLVDKWEQLLEVQKS